LGIQKTFFTFLSSLPICVNTTRLCITSWLSRPWPDGGPWLFWCFTVTILGVLEPFLVTWGAICGALSRLWCPFWCQCASVGRCRPPRSPNGKHRVPPGAMGGNWHSMDAYIWITYHLIPKQEAKMTHAGGQATEPHQPIVQATRGPTETKPDRTQPAQPQKTLWEKKEPSPTKRRSQGPSRTRSECTVY
jgi:hypothetical protein